MYPNFFNLWVTYLAICERLEACYNSNNYGGAPIKSILVFQCPKSGLTSCLAHHNYFATLPKRTTNVPKTNDLKSEADLNQLNNTKNYNTEEKTEKRLIVRNQSRPRWTNGVKNKWVIYSSADLTNITRNNNEKIGSHWNKARKTNEWENSKRFW